MDPVRETLTLEKKTRNVRFCLQPCVELLRFTMLTRDDRFYISYPRRLVTCEKHGIKESHEHPLTAEEIGEHLCHSSHYDRVQLLPNGTETTNNFEIVHVCSICRTTIKDPEKHFLQFHSEDYHGHLLLCDCSVNLQHMQDTFETEGTIVKVVCHESDEEKKQSDFYSTATATHTDTLGYHERCFPYKMGNVATQESVTTQKS